MIDFDSTYKDNYPKMYSVAMKMVDDCDVAGDIVQDIFVCYFEKVHNGLQVDYLQSWLIRATINKCIDYLNRQKKYAPLNAVNELADEEETLENQKNDVILRQAIAELKPVEMKIVVLYSEGYAYKEIARIAEIKFSSVGKTLSRTLLKLKEILKRLNYEVY
jgi:RNA polymerase sigma-70 factor (ECF subfamily)